MARLRREATATVPATAAIIMMGDTLHHAHVDTQQSCTPPSTTSNTNTARSGSPMSFTLRFLFSILIPYASINLLCMSHHQCQPPSQPFMSPLLHVRAQAGTAAPPCTSTTCCDVSFYPPANGVMGDCPTGGFMEYGTSCSITCNVNYNLSSPSTICHADGTLHTQDCIPLPVWQFSDWSSCSKVCGPGQQSRTATCGYPGGSSAPDEACGPMTEPLVRNCDNGCLYVWHMNGWSDCNATCGSGVQTQTASCIYTDDNSPADEQLCLQTYGEPGPLTQPCSNPCSTTCSYVNGACQSDNGFDCGSGSYTQTGICYYSDGTIAPGSECTNCLTTTHSCYAGSCFRWQSTGEYTNCSVTCGFGVESAIVVCMDLPNGIPAASPELCTDPQPETSQSCKIDNCYSWQTDKAFGSCTAPVGHCMDATQQRQVWCQDITNNVLVDVGNCTGSKPALEQACKLICDNNALSNLTVPGATNFTPPFTSSITSYDAIVPYEMSSAGATATAQDATAVITWDTQTVQDLQWPTTKQIQVTVTAQSGTIRTYTIDVLRAASNIASLAILSPSYGSLIPSFSPSTFNYSLLLPTSQSTVSMAAAPTDSSASLQWSPNPPLNVPVPGLPAYALIQAQVTAQDSTTILTYTVNVTRTASSNAQLTSISITASAPSGSTITLQPAFSVAVHEYNLTDRVPSTDTSIDLVVVPQDLTSSVTYQLNDDGWKRIDSSGSLIQVSGIIDGWNTIVVQSKAEDGVITLTYTCQFYRISMETRLASLVINPSASLFPSFSPDQITYALLASADDATLQLNATTISPTANITWSPSSTISRADLSTDLLKPLTITATVLAEDGVTHSTYTFQAYRQISYNNFLASLSINNSISFTPPFSPTQLAYHAVIPSNESSCSASASVQDPDASINWLNQSVSGLVYGVSKQIQVQVMAESGSSRLYVIDVSRAGSNQAALVNLTVVYETNDEEGENQQTHPSLTPPFSSSAFSYNLTLPRGINLTLNFSAQLMDDTASMQWSVNGGSDVNANHFSIPLQGGGNNTLEIRCTAQDGTTVLTYTVDILRERDHSNDVIPWDPPSSSSSSASAVRACEPNSFGPLCSFSLICLDGCITAYSSSSPIYFLTLGMDGIETIRVEGRDVAFNRTHITRFNATMMQQHGDNYVSDSSIASFLSIHPTASSFQLISFLPPSLIPLNVSNVDLDEWSWLNKDGSPRSTYHTLELIIRYAPADDDNKNDVQQDRTSGTSASSSSFYSLSVDPVRPFPSSYTSFSTPSSSSSSTPSSGRYLFKFDRLIYYSVSSCLSPGEYKPDGKGGCLPCPKGAVCVGGGRLYPKPGYWSSNEFTLPIECRIPEACPGGSYTSDGGAVTDACANGYTSTACSSCSADHYMLAGRCEACRGGELVSFAAFATLLLVGVIALTSLSIGVAVLPSRALAHLVTAFVVLQAAVAVGKSAVGGMSGEWWWLKQIISLLSVLNFDLELIKPGCVISPFNFVTLFWCTLLLLALAALMFFLATRIRRCVKERMDRRRSLTQVTAIHRNYDGTMMNNQNHSSSSFSVPPPSVSAKEDSRRRLTHSMMVLGSIFYLQFVTLQLKGVRCMSVPVAADGPNDSSDSSQEYMNVLIADPQTECFVGLHLPTVGVIGVTALLYTIGFPLICFTILCRSFGSAVTSGCLGCVIRCCSCLRREMPHMKRYRIIKARLTASGMSWEQFQYQEQMKKQQQMQQDGIAGEYELTEEEEEASHQAWLAMKEKQQVYLRHQEAQLTAEFNQYLLDSFGYLWIDLNYDHFAFRLTFFALSLFTALCESYISDLALRVLVLGCMFAAEALLICFTLPFGTFFQNLQHCAVYVAQVGYYAFLLGIHYTSDPSTRASFYTLCALCGFCVLLTCARRWMGEWIGCMKLQQKYRAIDEMMKDKKKKMDQEEEEEEEDQDDQQGPNRNGSHEKGDQDHDNEKDGEKGIDKRHGECQMNETSGGHDLPFPSPTSAMCEVELARVRSRHGDGDGDGDGHGQSQQPPLRVDSASSGSNPSSLSLGCAQPSSSSPIFCAEQRAESNATPIQNPSHAGTSVNGWIDAEKGQTLPASSASASASSPASSHSLHHARFKARFQSGKGGLNRVAPSPLPSSPSNKQLAPLKPPQRRLVPLTATNATASTSSSASSSVTTVAGSIHPGTPALTRATSESAIASASLPSASSSSPSRALPPLPPTTPLALASLSLPPRNSLPPLRSLPSLPRQQTMPIPMPMPIPTPSPEPHITPTTASAASVSASSTS